MVTRERHPASRVVFMTHSETSKRLIPDRMCRYLSRLGWLSRTWLTVVSVVISDVTAHEGRLRRPDKYNALVTSWGGPEEAYPLPLSLGPGIHLASKPP